MYPPADARVFVHSGEYLSDATLQELNAAGQPLHGLVGEFPHTGIQAYHWITNWHTLCPLPWDWTAYPDLFKDCRRPTNPGAHYFAGATPPWAGTMLGTANGQHSIFDFEKKRNFRNRLITYAQFHLRHYARPTPTEIDSIIRLFCDLHTLVSVEAWVLLQYIDFVFWSWNWKAETHNYYKEPFHIVDEYSQDQYKLDTRHKDCELAFKIPYRSYLSDTDRSALAYSAFSWLPLLVNKASAPVSPFVALHGRPDVHYRQRSNWETEQVRGRTHFWQHDARAVCREAVTYRGVIYPQGEDRSLAWQRPAILDTLLQ